MKQRPILFSTEMVQAILAGRKNQTRRTTGIKNLSKIRGDYEFKGMIQENGVIKAKFFFNFLQEDLLVKSPYGEPGDVLWVRETHTHTRDAIHSDGGWIYKASEDGRLFEDTYEHWRWKPSIFMPKEAARIWLKITSINIERIQSISRDDAMAEGICELSKDNMRTWKYGIPDIDGLPKSNIGHGWEWKEWKSSPYDAIKSLWCKINGTDSWQLNPWVWVVDFEVLSTTGKPDCITE